MRTFPKSPKGWGPLRGPEEPLGGVPVLLGTSQMSPGGRTESSSGISCLDIMWDVRPCTQNVPVIQPGDETLSKRALGLYREREKNPGIRAGSKGLVTSGQIFTGIFCSQRSH